MKKSSNILSFIIIVLTIALIIMTVMYFDMRHNAKRNLENTLKIAEENFESNKKIQELEEKLKQYSKEEATEFEYNKEETNNKENLNNNEIHNKNSKLIETERQLPPDNLNIDSKNPKEVLDRYLDLYCLIGHGIPLLVLENRGLNFYYNSEEANENTSDSHETITTDDGIEWELDKTNISYEAYKNALLNFVSEDVFEKEFTSTCKNVNGVLYILDSGGCGTSYSIENMDKISEEGNIVTYKVNCLYFEGENPAVEKEFLTKFEKDDYGIYRVSYFEIIK